MKKILLLFIALAVQYSLHSQSLTPFVISSTGNFSTATGFSLSSTTGESSMVQTFTASSGILTQGFQQPYDQGVGIFDPEKTFSLSWFPNPSSGTINLLGEFQHAGRLTIKITDNIGQLVYQVDRDIDGIISEKISLNHLAEGIYHVESLFMNNISKKTTSQINILSIIY